MSLSTMERPKTESLASSIASLTADERRELLSQLTNRQCEELLYDWEFWARPNQIAPPGNWRYWLLMAGRGFGKTKTGAGWIKAQQKAGYKWLGLVAPTAHSARTVMIEGESGILSLYRSGEVEYQPSKSRLQWPNGAIAGIYSAEEPERLRGPQHDKVWLDELGAWQYPQETWDQIMFGLRLGDNPQACITTTPKPIKLIRDLLANPHTAITRGSTYDNRANLPPAFFEEIIRKYEGTRIGRQELLAELLEDIPGALWNRINIDDTRVVEPPVHMARIVVAIDPAVTHGEESDETGIVVVGLGLDDEGYVLEDLSCRESPHQWASIAVRAYERWKADRIVAEVNNGGEMVEHTLRTVAPNVPYRAVRASRGKVIRAEPVAALYEQRRMHHVGTRLELLEDQMCTFVPDISKSPDRVDALVWGFTELMIDPEPTSGILTFEEPYSISAY